MSLELDVTIKRLKPIVATKSLSIRELPPTELRGCVKGWEVVDAEGIVYASIAATKLGHEFMFSDELETLPTRVHDLGVWVHEETMKCFKLVRRPPTQLIDLENQLMDEYLRADELTLKIQKAEELIEACKIERAVITEERIERLTEEIRRLKLVL